MPDQQESHYNLCLRSNKDYMSTKTPSEPEMAIVDRPVASSDAAAPPQPVGDGHVHGEPPRGRYLALLALTALGVVYGDIGTSPLYALRESFHGPHAIAPTAANIYGVLSLVFWSLIIVISVKYVGFILRADNHGEGGILALTALATHIRPLAPSPQRWIVLLGVIGAALLYGDGIITPAISVLSAVEGLNVATPLFAPYVVPLTIIILIALFLIQSRGTARIGRVFGPVMLLWFGILALLGIINIVQDPTVLASINPTYALTFFAENGLRGFLVLGTVFLVVTGGEALYADMGHVGKRPIRVAWFALVLPALLLNYFGQGALLLREPEAAPNVFYLMAPAWALYPLVILAACATIIASQALISGVFSITMQAENLGFLPRMRIIHTSAAEFGQIYIPLINWALMLACILCVIGFRTSSNLAAAYGIAVTSTMAITTVIFGIVTRTRWHWGTLGVAFLVSFFLIVDLAFLAANFVKIPQGGWFPLVVAVVLFTVMTTWKRGSRIVFGHEQHLEQPLAQLLERLQTTSVARAPGCAVFLSANPEGTPAALLANLHYNGVVHEQVLLTTVQVVDIPHITADERVTVTPLEQGFYQVVTRFGFMEEPDVPRALAQVAAPGLQFDLEQVPYFVNRTRVIPTDLPGMALWREKLYKHMRHNAASTTDFFRLPASRVFEIGTSVEM
jgi:KUP system potassium uptake protein